MRWCRMAHIVGRGDGLSKSRFIRERLFVWCVCVCVWGGGGGVAKCYKNKLVPRFFSIIVGYILR